MWKPFILCVETVQLWTPGERNKESSCGIICFSHPPCLILGTEGSRILPAWVTERQQKEGTIQINRSFFFPAQEDSCPEVIVPEISRWTFTVRDKGILLLPFQSSQAVLKYMSAVLQLLLFFPQLHACGSSLSCDRGVIIAGGSDWSPLSHQTLFAPVLQSRVGEDQAGTHPGPTISDNWLIGRLVQESPGNIHSSHYKSTHSPAPCRKLKNFHTKYAKTSRCQKKRLRERNAYLIPGGEFRMHLPSRVFLTLKETFPSTLLCGEMKF